MIKKWLKGTLAWLNYISVSIFCRIHFRKQEKGYIKMNNMPEISSEYRREIKKFWKRYIKNPSTVYHRWFTGANGIADARYIPEEFFFDKIERHYNDLSLYRAYADKSMYKRLMPEVKQPVTVTVNINGVFYDDEYRIISKEAAMSSINKEDRFVIKPTLNSGGGRNVQILDNNHDISELEKIVADYKKDFIIQKPIRQHPLLSEIHSASINTVRVISLAEGGEVSILSSIVRIGVNGANVDNECSGGINCGLDDEGRLSDHAFDGTGKRYDIHPQGYVFSKGVVPSFDKIIEVVKKAHLKLPYFGIVSWDFAVDEEGDPVMIEYNLIWSAINFHQLHHGPLFGDRTEEILEKVMANKNPFG